MRQALVTGGAGFIGSHIVGALLEQGVSVRVLDNFSSGRRENLTAVVRPDTVSRLHVFEGDLRDKDTVAQAVRGVDTVFHEAAFVSVPESMQRPLECFAVNVGGTSTLLDEARKAGVQRVVIASSAAVYGDSEAMPLNEEVPFRPLSPYAASKSADEVYAAMYTHAYGLPVACLRYFNVYGPRQRPDSMYAAAIPIFLSRRIEGLPVTIFGDGLQTRDLIYVGDVVRANLAAATQQAASGQVFNICTGQEISILGLLNCIDALIPGSEPPQFGPPRAGDIYKSVGDPARAARLLGFRAQTALEEGLKATLEWMR